MPGRLHLANVLCWPPAWLMSCVCYRCVEQGDRRAATSGRPQICSARVGSRSCLFVNIRLTPAERMFPSYILWLTREAMPWPAPRVSQPAAAKSVDVPALLQTIPPCWLGHQARTTVMRQGRTKSSVHYETCGRYTPTMWGGVGCVSRG